MKPNEIIEKHLDHSYETVAWKNQTTAQKVKTTVVALLKLFGVIFCVWIFICALKMMYLALIVLVGRVAGDVFSSNVFLSNPITGLIIGIVMTVIIQSSSTSVSIVVAMVAAGVMDVGKGIPIVMGANIGTSVTNTVVALTLSMDREEFRKAFSGATVHDCFNILSTLVFLTIEVITGYLQALTGAVVNSIPEIAGEGAPKFLGTITGPIADNMLFVNESVPKNIATNTSMEEYNSVIKLWCEKASCPYIIGTTAGPDAVPTGCYIPNDTSLITNLTVNVGVRKCDTSDFCFANTGWREVDTGAVAFVVSIIMLVGSMIIMVKILTSSLRGTLKKAIKKAVNTDIPSPFSWVSGYIAVFVSMGVTMLIQSSSVVTSTMTPLVGLDVVSLERMFAVTVGANMGTTTTAILAALATESRLAMQAALCHFFFNVSGFLLWYPIPLFRKLPISMARGLGNICAKYRWFSIVYIITVFLVIPSILLGISFGPLWLLITVVFLAITIILAIIVINVIQTKRSHWLPGWLQNWNFLPLCCHSFKPLDRCIDRFCGCCTCCAAKGDNDVLANIQNHVNTII